MALDRNNDQLIDKLMAAIAAMKRIVKKGRPLTENELKSLSIGMSVVETYISLWKIRSDVANRLSKNETGSSVATAEDRWTAIASLRRNSAAALLGYLGGAKGGRARANKLSPEKRAAIARRAAQVRWKRSPAISTSQVPGSPTGEYLETNRTRQEKGAGAIRLGYA